MTETTDRTYEIETAKGAFRITVPAGTRVSYGPVIGAAGKSSYGGNVLRFWSGTKTAEIQLALFGDVTSFRDLALPMQVKAVRLFGSGDDEWFPDDGSWVNGKAEQVERGWIATDALKLPPTKDHDPNVYATGGSVTPRSVRRSAFKLDEEDEVKF